VLGVCGDAMSQASRDGNDPLIGERGQLVWSPIVSQPRSSGNRRSCHAQRGSSEGQVPGRLPRIFPATSASNCRCWN